ncbi:MULTISPECIES: glycosyltransferase family 9 protein [Vibrio]|uniref:Lipopolysaccharide heptosyltransferase family protein n=1 Tax=Vibrio mediterranei TaxID=689 RepID=A0A3G4V8W5_9VIBR|nr:MULTISPECIES: glycosyltransferase family 9 protein [Vibrio]AYV21233.1 lipopolysaccharide heptosyltransferase family protein [Vibrio mediterranei]EDL53914.1 RfaF protein [Vibrio mediterranei AK1]USE00345.1 glycosyltransferase family 9 protein [Vibrio sp. SCSIO 43133]
MRKLISRLQLLRDQIRHHLGVMLFDKTRQTSAVQPDSFKHIVFLRTDAKLGDAFVSSFVFRDIKAHNPNIKLTVVTTPNMRSLFQEHLGADNVVELKKRPSYSEITKACIAIGSCDLLVSLNLNPKMKDLFFLSQCKAKHIAGLDDSLQIVDIKLGEKTRDLHFAERFATLLKEIGIEAHHQNYIIPQTTESKQTAQNFIERHELTNFVVINAYGSGNSRKLNAQSIKRLVGIIHKHAPELTIVLLSSPETYQQTEQAIENHKLIAIHYDTSKNIFDVVSLVARAKFTVSVDTAIVHMAAGLKVLQLALYNPDPENFTQWHPNSVQALTSKANHSSVPDINRLNWPDVEQKLLQLIQEK